MKLIITSQDYRNKKFDLTKEGSDFGVNQIVLHALIGTLVKYGPSGKITPYLASSWEISDDKKSWRFKIRENLIADDGTSLSSEKFHSILLGNLKSYSQRSKVMIFDTLVGWDDFINQKSDSITGFSYDSQHVHFLFSKKPDDFFELLQMPYFGFWLEDENNKIISTSGYRLSSHTHGEVNLTLRENWFSSSEKSFKNVNVVFGSTILKDIKLDSHTIVQMPYETSVNQAVPNTYWVQGTPTIIDTFVLSPYKEGFFKDPKNRSVFLNRINMLPESLIESRFFYPTAPSNLPDTSSIESYSYTGPDEVLTFALERSNFQELEINKFNEIISYALQGSGVNFKVLEKDNNDKDWYKKTDSNKYFDSRISSVSIGAYPLLSAIKMMFCTNLGVSFPDFNQQITHLVEDYEVNELDIDQGFIERFNKIIQEQAIIIPIKHHSKKWLVTDDISPKSLPATSPFLMFEKIEYE